MITQILQNLVRPTHLPHSSEASFLTHRGDESLFRAAISRVKGTLVEALRQQSNETENRKAIEHLNELTEEQLLDMGITRMDIAHVVRHGKV